MCADKVFVAGSCLCYHKTLQGKQENRKLHMQPSVISPLRGMDSIEGAMQAGAEKILSSGRTSSAKLARASFDLAQVRQGAAGMLSAELIENRLREAMEPMEAEVLTLRKQVVQLQLQLAQGFQEHREDMRLLLREHLKDSNQRDERTEFSTQISEQMKRRPIVRLQDAQPGTLRPDSRSNIAQARVQEGGERPGHGEEEVKGVRQGARGEGGEQGQEWADQFQVGRIQWGLQPLPDLGQNGGGERIDESGVFKVGAAWAPARQGAGGGNGGNETASTISENDSPPVSPRTGLDSMVSNMKADRKTSGAESHVHQQPIPIFRSPCSWHLLKGPRY